MEAEVLNRAPSQPPQWLLVSLYLKEFPVSTSHIHKTYSLYISNIQILSLSLSLSAPSSAPQNFAAVSGEREVEFSWSAPPITQQNGVITSYILSCYPSPSSLPQFPSSGPLTVTGLSPDTGYSCSLVASNSQGSGPPANISFTTQQDCEPFSRPNSELNIDIV